MRRRAPGAAPARPACPAAADDVPVPAHYRARSDNRSHRRQALGRHRPRKQRQPRPVRPCQTRMSARPLALSHSELMAQHKDLGVFPPPLPPRQPQQRHGTNDNQEDQLQPHKLKIVPRPGRRRGPSSQRSGASGQVAQVFGPHSPHRPRIRHQATLRPRITAQIRFRRNEHPQVNAVHRRSGPWQPTSARWSFSRPEPRSRCWHPAPCHREPRRVESGRSARRSA